MPRPLILDAIQVPLAASRACRRSDPTIFLHTASVAFSTVETLSIPPESPTSTRGARIRQKTTATWPEWLLCLRACPNLSPASQSIACAPQGLEAVNQASRAILVGDGDLFVAGGVSPCLELPYSVPRGTVAPKAGNLVAYDTSLGWRYPNPKMEELFPLEAMGCTAENLVERYGISREDQDAFALHSHQKALAAQEAGHFDDDSALPHPTASGKDPFVLDRDEGPRRTQLHGETRQAASRLSKGRNGHCRKLIHTQ